MLSKNLNEKKEKKRALGNLNYQKFPQLSMVQLALIFSYIVSPFSASNLQYLSPLHIDKSIVYRDLV